MAIRDKYIVQMTNGKEYVVSATKQGGTVKLDDNDDDLITIRELTVGGLLVRSLRVNKGLVESIELRPDKAAKD